MIGSIQKIQEKVTFTLWGLFCLLLPFSNMPFVVKMLGSDSVGSPVILVSLSIIIIWLIPQVLKNKGFSSTWVPLILFLLVATISVLLSNFLEIPYSRGIEPIRENFEAMATVAIGASVFLVSSAYPKDKNALHFTMRMLNWGALFLVIWSIMQFIAWYGFHEYPKWMFDIQGLLSRRVFFRARISGFALEPSWLANMLNLVYIPLWLSATLKKFSSYRFRLFGFTIENLLLAVGIFILFFTLSRVGYLAFFLIMLVVGIWGLKFIFHKLEQYLVRRTLKSSDSVERKRLSQRVRFIIVISFLVFILLSVFLTALVVVRIDQRMARLFEFSLNSNNPVLEYFNNLKFGERTIYWIAGWKIFNDYPLMGVGLGNAGFFMPSRIIPYGWSMIEVRRILYREPYLLNIKSFWIRLLAETGIVGFSCFFAWYIDLFKRFRIPSMQKDGVIPVFILSGIFTLVAYLIEGFSIDSFAIPYFWVGTGLAISALRAGVTDIDKRMLQ